MHKNKHGGFDIGNNDGDLLGSIGRAMMKISATLFIPFWAVR